MKAAELSKTINEKKNCIQEHMKKIEETLDKCTRMKIARTLGIVRNYCML